VEHAASEEGHLIPNADADNSQEKYFRAVALAAHVSGGRACPILSFAQSAGESNAGVIDRAGGSRAAGIRGASAVERDHLAPHTHDGVPAQAGALRAVGDAFMPLRLLGMVLERGLSLCSADPGSNHLCLRAGHASLLVAA